MNPNSNSTDMADPGNFYQTNLKTNVTNDSVESESVLTKPDSILIFLTSLSSADQVQKIKHFLEKVFKKGEQWNFDLEDRDRILKIKRNHIPARDIIRTMQSAGYFCEELEEKATTFIKKTA